MNKEKEELIQLINLAGDNIGDIGRTILQQIDFLASDRINNLREIFLKWKKRKDMIQKGESVLVMKEIKNEQAQQLLTEKQNNIKKIHQAESNQKNNDELMINALIKQLERI